MLPVLEYVQGMPHVSIASSREPMIRRFAISPEDSEALLPSGQQTVLSNRLSWSFNYLLRAGLLERPSHGVYEITDRGRDVLRHRPARIDVPFLRQFQEFTEFVDGPAADSKKSPELPSGSPPDPDVGAGDPDAPPSDLPKLKHFILPVLKTLAKGDASASQMSKPIADLLSLTQEQAAELLPSGTKTRVSDRISWSLTYLKKAGLIRRVSSGVYSVTPEGEKVIAENPEIIDVPFLNRYPDFRNYYANRENAADGTATQPGSPAPGETDEDEDEDEEKASTLTPDEMMELTANELQASIKAEIKREIQQLSPTAFEKLIIEVMRGLKYSARGTALHTGKSKDGGIDGIITEDALGLDSIYLQAKRYVGSSVTKMEIQAFAGAMDGHAVTKGVFVTFSTFTKDAENFAKVSPKHIRLINGNELVELMYNHNIGVRTHRSIELKRVDQDFFKDLEG